ncbi:MAG TPA: Do family serine endopeptidase [Nevskia sp.]|nr:Do family serine endopeptidase [Nevskia sp.]
MARMSFVKTAAAAAGAALLATFATLSLTTTSPSPVHADIPPALLAPLAPGQVPSLAPMLKTVLPTVVNIAVSAKVQIQNPLLNDPFFRRFFNVPNQPQEREEQAIGSGVIVDAAKGYVLTNNHVVAQADKIKVRLNDDRQVDAKLIGTDPQTDLAVLQIKADGLTALPLGDSDALQVGDFVVAIGSPFNLRQTVTSGIVSGLGRRNAGGDDGAYQDFIQTDASINPGNSGGALINLKGELVGINSQILSGSGGSIGIGFSIPVNLAKSVMAQLIASGKVDRGRIGIVGQPITPELAKAFNLKDTHGALVTRVLPGSPADKAGIKVDDVVVQANGKAIKDMPELRNLIGLLKVGDKVDLTVLRSGESRKLTVVVGKNADEKLSASAKDKDSGGDSGGKGLNSKLKGATFGPVQDADVKGVAVTDIEQDSPAAQSGLAPGDIIMSVNRHPVTSLAEFQKYAGSEGDLLLYIRRGDGALYLALQ